MKNWILLLLGLVLLSILPTPGTELGELHPISALIVDTEGKQLRLTTDTLDCGVGETLDAALKNLEDTTPGHLFVETVEYLIITEQTRYLLPQLKQILRPGVAVCLGGTEIDPKSVPEFLGSHIPNTKLADAQKTGLLEKLSAVEGRYILEGE